MTLEVASEMTLIGEAHLSCDRRNRQIRRFEQSLRPRRPLLEQILMRCEPRSAFEQTTKVVGTHLSRLGQRDQADVLR